MFSNAYTVDLKYYCETVITRAKQGVGCRWGVGGM
jgi:hypothetical protein